MTSVAPYFVLTAGFLAFAWLLGLRVGFYRTLLSDEASASRFHAVDGLRGYLALGVFFHHAVVNYNYYRTDRWELVGSTFYVMTGQVGVSLFFMITGFLFWSKGLAGTLDVSRFLEARVRRLVPMYVVSVLAVFLIVFVLTGAQLRVAPNLLLRQLLAWLSFGFLPTPNINGLNDTFAINNVYWTLAFEWGFYLALPLCLVFARGWRFGLLVGVIAAYGAWIGARPLLWNFVFGAIAAIIVRDGRYARIFASRGAAIVAALALVAVFRFDGAYGLPQCLLMFAFFLFVAQGNSVFGLLTSMPARLLGTVSYSIYLVHTIVLYVVLRTINAFAPVSGLEPVTYWALMTLCGLLVIVVSCITFRYVEYPFIGRPRPLREMRVGPAPVGQ
ncbi:MAG: acyltransferase [Acidobacteriota bacterium]